MPQLRRRSVVGFLVIFSLLLLLSSSAAAAPHAAAGSRRIWLPTGRRQQRGRFSGFPTNNEDSQTPRTTSTTTRQRRPTALKDPPLTAALLAFQPPQTTTNRSRLLQQQQQRRRRVDPLAPSFRPYPNAPHKRGATTTKLHQQQNQQAGHHSSCLSPPEILHRLLQSEMDGTRPDSAASPILLPCCYDGLTARLVARYGTPTPGSQQQQPPVASARAAFSATFLTGFGASAVSGYPDTQLLSYDEMLAQCRSVAAALANVALERRRHQQTHNINDSSLEEHHCPIPCIADGDTGYGNAVNAKRTVFGYGRAGMAGIMVEDQVAPKRCGHVAGKSIVPLTEAVARIRAACDARDEYAALYGAGTGPLILARTDARQCATGSGGFDDAIERCLAFREAGADMTFLEAPQSIDEMRDYCRLVPGPKLANMLEQGSTPIVSPSELKAMGYTMAAYPLTLLSASIQAMQLSLDRIYNGIPTDDIISTFAETKDIVGFTQYAAEEERYRVDS